MLKKTLDDFENFDLNSIRNNSIDISDILTTKKIIIYPAGVSGQLVQKTLLESNINIECFIDKSFQTLKRINNVPVYNSDTFKEFDDNYLVIIATNLNTQYEFFKKNVQDINSNINIIDGKNLNRLLKSPKCIEKLDNHTPFNLIECENCGFERKNCPISTSYLRREGKFKAIENDKRSVKFNWFGYIVSQTCTLKCEHCCEQVPYLLAKGFTPIEVIINDVKKLAQSSKFLNFVELVGGEPFLHPQIEQLITELLKIENIGYIKSFTNGTIIPSDKLCTIMKDTRFMLQVSNYEQAAKGKLLNNISKTKEKLDSFGIQYIFTRDFEWLDFSSFDEHEASEEYLKTAFNNCFLKNCNRVYQGKLYRCPHHYAGIQLNKLKEYPIECVDIHSMNTEALSRALNKFEDIEYLDACKHCDLAFDAKAVPAGKQL